MQVSLNARRALRRRVIMRIVKIMQQSIDIGVRGTSLFSQFGGCVGVKFLAETYRKIKYERNVKLCC